MRTGRLHPCLPNNIVYVSVFCHEQGLLVHCLCVHAYMVVTRRCAAVSRACAVLVMLSGQHMPQGSFDLQLRP